MGLVLGSVLAVAPDVATGAAAVADEDKSVQAKSVYDFTVKDIDGKELALSKYKGKALLIVNVASL